MPESESCPKSSVSESSKSKSSREPLSPLCCIEDSCRSVSESTVDELLRAAESEESDRY